MISNTRCGFFCEMLLRLLAHSLQALDLPDSVQHIITRERAIKKDASDKCRLCYFAIFVVFHCLATQSAAGQETQR